MRTTIVVALGLSFGLSVPVMAGQPTLLPPLFPHQFRYNTDAVGCGVLDRGGRFVESYQCKIILTFNTSVTAGQASGGKSQHVESIHYQATTQLGALLSSRHVGFSGTATGMPCFVSVLGLYDPALFDLSGFPAPWSTDDWQENITPDGKVQLDCFVHAHSPS